MSASPRTRDSAPAPGDDPDLDPGSALSDPVPSSDRDDAPLLDRYVIEGLVGRGGMGSVYRAFDTRLERAVAIKILAPRDGDESVARALREARASAAIHHPWVAEVFDAGRAGEHAFIVMELVPGVSLRSLVGDASIDLPTRIRWLAHVAVALAYTHRLGVIHRDVKPENVIVRDDGVIKVLDFGIARLPRLEGAGDRATLSRAGAILGTPAYMAPEHARGHDIDGRADQFAWGVLAYELLTGRMPWQRAAGALGVLAAVLCDDPEPVDPAAGVPPAVLAVVLRALSKDRDQRFPSMADVAAALAPHAAPATAVPPPSVSGPASPAPVIAEPPPPSMDPAPSSADPVSSAAPPRSMERPSRPRYPDLSPPTQPSSSTLSRPGRVRRASESLPPARRGPLPTFRDPDFSRPVDLRAHQQRLPPDATGKGMFFSELVDLCAASRVDLPALAGVAPRRYLSFNDYPLHPWMALVVSAAGALHPRVPRGEGLRRLGWSALDTVLASRMGRTVLGMFDRDVEMILTHCPKIYRLTLSVGRVTVDRVGPRTFIYRATDLPLFLETWNVGVLEGVLRHTGARGTVRIATTSLSDATYEVTLR